MRHAAGAVGVHPWYRQNFRPKRPTTGKRTRLADWHLYADRIYRDTLTCIECKAMKPSKVSPKGWMKRVTYEAKTQARCPKCSEPAA
jgi:hypothetical protein